MDVDPDSFTYNDENQFICGNLRSPAKWKTLKSTTSKKKTELFCKYQKTKVQLDDKKRKNPVLILFRRKVS